MSLNTVENNKAMSQQLLESNISVWYQDKQAGTSLVVQWLRLHAVNAEGVGSIPGQGTKIPHAMARDQKIKKKKKR